VVKFIQDGDRTLLTVNARSLEKQYKWSAKRKVWTAYLTGLLAGKKAMENKVKKTIPDIGRYTPSKGAIVFAALKGAIDAGLEMGLDEEKVPTNKLAAPPDSIKKEFEELKKKIMAG
jgi:large subunit ribosomal protein L18